MRSSRFKLLIIPGLGFLLAASVGRAQSAAECLACHSDATLQDASGKSVSVDEQKFHASIHSGMNCVDCHSTIKAYPHPDKVAKVKCEGCHTDEASQLATSVHSSAKDHPCTSCHGNAHEIVAKTDPRSAVFPLNIPHTCGQCHGDGGMAEKHGLQSVAPRYVDSIHGYALSKEGLLVAANCSSCHGSHHILSHNDPKSSTYKDNIPQTCGKCHAGTLANYMGGVHEAARLRGRKDAPVCADCHTAHDIKPPTDSAFRSQSTPICGSCHKDKFSTYRDTFHSQLGSFGGYVETARCWDCHGAHDVLPASDPRSPIAPQNLIATCGKCHAGANASFVKYQPHANAHDWHSSPALYYIRLFMNVLLISVLTFFILHTILWLIRARIQQMRSNQDGGTHE